MGGLEKLFERKGYLVKNFLEKTQCILEIQPDSNVAACKKYDTEHCFNSIYRDRCNYAREKDSEK